MPIQQAKQAFTREEIVDILQRNLSLFRDDPNVMAYIVELGLYLIDQAYVVGGERAKGLADHPEAAGDAIVVPFPEDTSAAPEGKPRRRITKGAPPAEPPDPDRPTNKMRLQDLQAVIKAPPPPLLAEEEELDPSTDQLRDLRHRTETAMRERADAERLEQYSTPPEEDMDDTGADFLASPPPPPDDQRRSRPEPAQPMTPKSLKEVAKQLPSVGYITPSQPGGGLPGRENDPRRSRPAVQRQEGRANIYRPVRPDTAARERQWVCPVCGTDTKGSRICPSCGNIL